MSMRQVFLRCYAFLLGMWWLSVTSTIKKRDHSFILSLSTSFPTINIRSAKTFARKDKNDVGKDEQVEPQAGQLLQGKRHTKEIRCGRAISSFNEFRIGDLEFLSNELGMKHSSSQRCVFSRQAAKTGAKESSLKQIPG